MILRRPDPPPAHPARPAGRPGFTLLEVLLASGISLLLMGALYVAMDLQFRQAQVGREALEQSTLVRSVLNRVITDLKPSLAPVTSTTTNAAEDDPTGGVLTALVYPLNAGVFGDSSTITVFQSRVPDDPNRLDPYAAAAPSDLRRISYWVAAGGGLVRHETPWVTAEDVMASVEPDYANEQQYVLAPEVTAVTFEYFDGAGWVEYWDGSMPGPDGVTAQGPPLAIAVTLQFELPGSRGTIAKSVRHVIAVPTLAGTAGVDPAMMTEGF